MATTNVTDAKVKGGDGEQRSWRNVIEQKVESLFLSRDKHEEQIQSLLSNRSAKKESAGEQDDEDEVLFAGGQIKQRTKTHEEELEEAFRKRKSERERKESLRRKQNADDRGGEMPFGVAFLTACFFMQQLNQ